MTKFLFVVFTEPKEGRDDEYNDWYDQQHLLDTLAIDGITAARRYTLAEMQPPQSGHPRYLALYEIDVDDINKVPKAIARARANGLMPISDAMDPSATAAAYYESRSEPERRNIA